MKSSLETNLEIDRESIIDYKSWVPPKEIKNFVCSHKRTPEPIRDIIICYLMILSAWLASFANPVWWVYLISCLTVTSALVGFIALTHESFHDNLASKKINDFLAKAFVAPPLLMDYDFEKQIHLNHHKFLGTRHDPTLSAYSCSSKELCLNLLSRILLVGSLTWIIKKRSDPKHWHFRNISLERRFWNLFMLLEQILIFILFVSIAPIAYLWNWILPLVLCSVFSSIREYGEHKSFDKVNDICIANTHTNIIERLLISQFNFTHHAAHHLFPKVPYNYLIELTALLNKYGWPQINIPIVIRNSYIENLFKKQTNH